MWHPHVRSWIAFVALGLLTFWLPQPLLAQGHFALDALVVTGPAISVSNLTRSATGNVSLTGGGMPGLTHRVLATTNLASPTSWQFISTNLAAADGTWQLTDTNAPTYPARYYRASLP